jgi:hypothetical protein
MSSVAQSAVVTRLAVKSEAQEVLGPRVISYATDTTSCNVVKF